MQQSYDSDNWVLAPFCDLICVRVYPQVSHHLALGFGFGFGFGGQFDPMRIDREALAVFAAQTRLTKKVIAERVTRMIEAIERSLPQACAETEEAQENFHSEGAARLIGNIVTEIRGICRHVKDHAIRDTE